MRWPNVRKNYTKSPLTQGKKARARALGENGKIARVLCSPFLCHIPNKGTIKGDNKKHDLATFYYEMLRNKKKKVFAGDNILHLLAFTQKWFQENTILQLSRPIQLRKLPWFCSF